MLKNEGQAYANEVVPRARGMAARLLEEANGYTTEVVQKAEGDASRFLAVLGEYEKAPEVTRERLYLDAIQNVLGNTSKVMMDVEGGNSLMYLPLDKIVGGSGIGAGRGLPRINDFGNNEQSQSEQPLRDVNRGRRVR